MHRKGEHKGRTEDEILSAIKERGFDPLRIYNFPNTVYPMHSHPETKILVPVNGKMEVVTREGAFKCSPGDELVIPGNVEHMTIIGEEGCTFFWAEKIL